MYKLIIEDDEGKTTVVPLIRDEITIGRKEGNTIRLTERNVSRRHARLSKANGTVYIEDLQSYNGIRVNGDRIAGRAPITEGDRVQIGDYQLALKLDKSVPSPDDAGSDGKATPFVKQDDGRAPADAPTRASPIVAAAGSAPTAASATIAAPSEAPAERPARLVGVSSNFAGQEFRLDKPQSVIGRIEENDVVINHRSISRHHAKIVRDNGRYQVVDLGSANGVRVNGEDYGKVELRRGDMIDLGHVRLRYVEPGEDFVFERDAQLVDVATKRGGKGALVAALSLIVVGAVVAVVFVTQRGGGEGQVASTEPQKPTAEKPALVASSAKPLPPVAAAPAAPVKPLPMAAAPAASASPDAAPAAAAVTPPTAPKADPAKEVARLLTEAKQAMTDEKWVAALAAVDQIQKLDPENAEAKKIQEQANSEFRNQTTYEKFSAARDAGRTADAVKLAKDIPDGSSYHAKAAADLDKLHDQFVKAREGEARGYAAKGQCDKILALARRSGDIFADARTAVEKAGVGCVQVASGRPAEPPAATPSTPAAPADAVLSETQIASLITDAKEAARNNNWAEARRKADEVLKVRPGDQDALSVAGIAACNLSDRERALRYIDRLKGERQHMMKQICAAKGVPID
jgi:pSer/pThr/pTyr-binding forkhead associated (FHA) protein